ncbi:MAG: SxtJ family membrane protein [Chthoniobacterales bacterium]
MALRSFGFTVGTALLLVGAILIWRDKNLGWFVAVAGALLVLLARIAPAKLRLFHRAWMSASLALGWIMTNLILTIIFFLVVTPLGLLQRLLGKRPLDVAFRSSASSYWRGRARPHATASEFERQF